MKSQLMPILLCVGIWSVGTTAAYASESTPSPNPGQQEDLPFVSGRAGDTTLGELSLASSLGIELSEGESVPALLRMRRTFADWSGKPVTTWEGILQGFDGSEVLLTQRAGLTVGTIRRGQERWYLFPDGALKKVDDAAALPCGTKTRNTFSPDFFATLETRTISEADAATSPALIDVLAVYDSTFLEAAGGAAGAELLITDAVVRANQAERNSVAGAQYQLVGIVKLSVRIPPQGPFTVLLGAEVKALREQYGADLVQGYLSFVPDQTLSWGGLSNGYHEGADTGYASVVNYAAVHLETPAHEFGHNRGADHEEQTATRSEPARPFGYCPPDGGDGWGTIMWSGRTPLSGRCLWTKLNVFSNPHTFYAGLPLGIKGKQDNALVMRATARQLAAFRAPHAQAAACTPDSHALCLNQGRFKVTGTWTTQDGRSGQAHAVKLTDETGYLWFFNSENVEVIVKVLNACSYNGRFWVFAGGLTNIKTGLTILDTHTGVRWASINPQGVAFQPVQDAFAFATCP